MADLTVTKVSRDGVDLGAVAAAAGGDAFLNTGQELLYIKDAAGGGLTLTIVTQNTIDGQTVSDRMVVIADSEEKLIGPFPPEIYNDDNNKVQLTYDDVVNVTVAAFRP